MRREPAGEHRACASPQTRSTHTRAQVLRHAARTLAHSTRSTHTCTALTRSTHTRAQALRHAARTLAHSTHMQHAHTHKLSDTYVHVCTSTRTCSMYTRALVHSSQTRGTHTRAHTLHRMCTLTHAATYTCFCPHTQQFPTGGVGLSRGRGRCVPHPPCNTRPGPRRSGTSRTGSWSSSAASTSARRSWLWRVQPLSGTAPLPRHPGWSRHCPSVDQTRPLPSGQVSKVPLPSRQLPGHGGWPVGVRASGRGHHPRISRPSAGSLGQLPPRATVSQPQGSRQPAAGRPLLTHPLRPPPGSPSARGQGPTAKPHRSRC